MNLTALPFILALALPESSLYSLTFPKKVKSGTAQSRMAVNPSNDSRRQVVAKIVGFAGAALSVPQMTLAEVDVSTVEMKEFVDPYGLFSIKVPQGFYTIRRKAKGDLPDEKTGKGRRGSSIFTAGNMAKAEVIAVER